MELAVVESPGCWFSVSLRSAAQLWRKVPQLVRVLDGVCVCATDCGTTLWKCVLHNPDAFPCQASRVGVGLGRWRGGGVAVWGLIHYLWSAAPRLLQNLRNAPPFVRLWMAIFGRSSGVFFGPQHPR